MIAKLFEGIVYGYKYTDAKGRDYWYIGKTKKEETRRYCWDL